jgi:hypothetical protein
MSRTKDLYMDTIEELEMTIIGLEEDINNIVRVAYENPNDLLKFVKDNYINPKYSVLIITIVTY